MENRDEQEKKQLTWIRTKRRIARDKRKEIKRDESKKRWKKKQ